MHANRVKCAQANLETQQAARLNISNKTIRTLDGYISGVQYRHESPTELHVCSLNISNYKPIFYNITVNRKLETEISVSFRILT